MLTDKSVLRSSSSYFWANITVISGQGPSSSGGPLWSMRKKPGRGVRLTSLLGAILKKKSGLGSHS